ncbi:MAG: threonylcarbamoyl-AMP synthase [Bifidobacteriaceae bacterium]|jgi:tRNA threonylcarbamoyl adenosine modification protein (Sua5/YciO/YrdC/YwlC family)|nr:threonylcarbamoyl-AMP synthase [Bifidobacteriaceae bacterium]
MLVTSTDTPATGDLSDAAAAVARGELIVIPTDTVYGLGANPFDAAATARLFAAKARPTDMPLPVLVADLAAARTLAAEWPQAAERLAQAFWPGPLTIIVAAAPSAGLRLGGSGRTVGLRQPDHPTALALLKATGPLAVTSANRSGEPPATTAADAVRQLGPAVAVCVDAGRAPGEVPSTVVDLSGPEPLVLREGGIGQAELRGALGGRAGRPA